MLFSLTADLLGNSLLNADVWVFGCLDLGCAVGEGAGEGVGEGVVGVVGVVDCGGGVGGVALFFFGRCRWCY